MNLIKINRHVIIETRLSDFQNMTLTVMKRLCKKQNPNILTYRIIKAFTFHVKNNAIQMTSENNMDLKKLFINLFKDMLQ